MFFRPASYWFSAQGVYFLDPRTKILTWDLLGLAREGFGTKLGAGETWFCLLKVSHKYTRNATLIRHLQEFSHLVNVIVIGQ